MIPTLDYIERKFNEFNALMFEGKLQPLPFKLSTARTFLGQVKYQQRRLPDGSRRFTNFQFVISTRVDLPEAEVEDTIIHEMIHYWILSNQLQDNRPHGDIFRRKMQEINLTFHRHITVRHKMSQDEVEQDREVRQHLICVSRLRDGRCGITVAAKSRLFQFWDKMPHFPGVIEQYWVLSLDPFFNRFPRALTPKIYPVPADDLEIHLQDAKPLVRTGNSIHT